MNTVNIVMATYNGENYIAKQLESILNSTYTDWSLTICDDGSTDRTVLIAEEYRKEYPERIHIIENEVNLGGTLNFLSMINKLGNASCKEDVPIVSNMKSSSNPPKYYMFCDQDDYWFSDKIEQTIHRMQVMEQKYGKENPLLVFSDTTITDAELKVTHPSFYATQKYNLGHLDLAHMLLENKCIGCTMMFNDALLSRITELPKQARFHDWWVALIAASFGKISYMKQPTMYYRQHGKNEVGGVAYSEYIKKRVIGIKDQKKSVKATCNQAKDFYQIYGKSLSNEQGKMVYAFAHLYDYGWLKRRYVLLRYRILKSGVLRNIGVLLIV